MYFFQWPKTCSTEPWSSSRHTHRSYYISSLYVKYGNIQCLSIREIWTIHDCTDIPTGKWTKLFLYTPWNFICGGYRYKPSILSIQNIRWAILNEYTLKEKLQWSFHFFSSRKKWQKWLIVWCHLIKQKNPLLKYKIWIWTFDKH